MKEVKTITHSIDSVSNFDERINDAIKNGWTLVGRQAVSGYSKGEYSGEESKLVAFLEREVKEEYL